MLHGIIYPFPGKQFHIQGWIPGNNMMIQSGTKNGGLFERIVILIKVPDIQ